MANEPSFDVPCEAEALIGAILKRFEAIGGRFPQGRMSVHMDLCACHANGCPLDFEKLATTDDFTLAHDVAGIIAYMDRETGRLTGHFLPRCALPPSADTGTRTTAQEPTS